LKKCETTGLWFEIGDDAAREKTSQALRQRAPELRKILIENKKQEETVQYRQPQEQEAQQQPVESLNQRQPTLDSLASLFSTRDGAARSSAAAVVARTTPFSNFSDTHLSNPVQSNNVNRSDDLFAPLFHMRNNSDGFHPRKTS
jgi:hypothetical protein